MNKNRAMSSREKSLSEAQSKYGNSLEDFDLNKGLNELTWLKYNKMYLNVYPDKRWFSIRLLFIITFIISAFTKSIFLIFVPLAIFYIAQKIQIVKYVNKGMDIYYKYDYLRTLKDNRIQEEQ
jgi:hypothetical protein